MMCGQNVYVKTRPFVQLSSCITCFFIISMSLAVSSDVVACPPLDSVSVHFTCHLGGQQVNCATDTSAGVSVFMTCKKGYVMRNFTRMNTRRCSELGVWSGSMLDCVPEATTEANYYSVQPVTTVSSGGVACQPLRSASVDFTCYLGGQRVSCANATSSGVSVFMTCEKGYVMKSFTRMNTRQCSEQGVWSGSMLDCVPVSSGVAACQPLSSVSVDFTCYLGGQRVSCETATSPGVSAFMTCKKGYVLFPFNPNNTRQCSEQGMWSGSMLGCVEDCGRRNFVVQAFVAGGDDVTAGEFPWHVGIYKVVGENNMKQICGGTMVTTAHVITAAHCVWDEVRHEKHDYTLYKLAAEKYYRAWDVTQDAVQKRDVAEILVHPRFNGMTLRLASDIAVVRVEVPFELSTLVNVICMDWQLHSEYTTLAPRSNGTVVGWGVTEEDVPSPVLLSAQLPYVTYEDCKSIVPSDFLSYLTGDKICGGWLNRGIGVCEGDSGGGYVFPLPAARGAQYYLRGIVSVAPRTPGLRCIHNQIATFTKVSEHFSWLQEIVFHNK